MKERIREAVGVAIIDEEKRILLVREGEVWKIPGGKPEPGESDTECLQREVAEELSGAEVKSPRFFRSFEGVTPKVGDVLRAKVYQATLVGADLVTSEEIDEFRWISDFEEFDFPEITAKIILALQEEGIL